MASVAGVDMTRNDLKDIAFDGANLIPYLSGENEGEPERILFNKSGDYSFLINLKIWKFWMKFLLSSISCINFIYIIFLMK